MELKLGEELEQWLSAEAAALGISVEEVSAQVLTQHASEWRMRQRPKANDRGARIDAHIALMKMQIPNYGTADPYMVDWQAVKAEGRRY